MASKEEIDEQLIGILDELSALVKEKVRIFEIFKSGLFDVSTAKIREDWYNYSSLFCNSDMTRQIFVTVEKEEERESVFNYHLDPNGGVVRGTDPKISVIDEKKDSERGELRHRKEKSTLKEDCSEVVQEPGCEKEVSQIRKQLKDPITMFSVFPPKSLREGQKTFQDLVPQLIEIVNKETRLRKKIELFTASL